MTSRPRAVEVADLGAWLVKCSPRTTSVGELVGSGFATISTWCLRRSYRTDLVAPGQAVLLWVSGGDPAHPPGIYAQGRTTGAVLDEAAGETVLVPVALERVDPSVPRSTLVEHPGLSRCEVLRMPAGSNPSYLTRAQVHQLRAAWPQVTVGPGGSARERP